MGLCPIPCERNFLKEVPLDSSRTFIGEKRSFSLFKVLESYKKTFSKKFSWRGMGQSPICFFDGFPVDIFEFSCYNNMIHC